MSNKYPCVYYDNGKCQKLSDDHYTAWCDFDSCESRTPSNGDRIRAMSDEELAKRDVQDFLEYTVDYDWDETPIGEYTPCFKTSDGAIFWYYEDAVKYEISWLREPYKEDT